MKSTIRFSTIAATVALSAIGVSTAFSATYVPHEDNFGLSTSVTVTSLKHVDANVAAHTEKAGDTTQTASVKTVATPMDSKFVVRQDFGSAM